MKSFALTLSEESKITLPPEVQDVLGIHPSDDLVVVIMDGKVELQPVNQSVVQLAGSVPPLKYFTSDEAHVREARDEKIEREIRKLAEE
jgi:bifunctional DNA-binding transcriptional regulator/antitoxin component of YhaV-PrlF toxin-antitoxin module